MTCMMRGIAGYKAQKTIIDKVQATKLEEKVNARVCDLSAGQKRKVSICMALIGKARFVVMDEPTANLDLKSREMVWDVILDLKKTQPKTAFLIST